MMIKNWLKEFIAGNSHNFPFFRNNKMYGKLYTKLKEQKYSHNIYYSRKRNYY
jgi:hypothetical protein